ncbi:hypothetical protein J1614_000792 [Plenodomus biglobosus]|nr:hypothetical protein J1614_000792 [Plenodomus biglobosus]
MKRPIAIGKSAPATRSDVMRNPKVTDLISIECMITYQNQHNGWRSKQQPAQVTKYPEAPIPYFPLYLDVPKASDIPELPAGQNKA